MKSVAIRVDQPVDELVINRESVFEETASVGINLLVSTYMLPLPTNNPRSDVGFRKFFLFTECEDEATTTLASYHDLTLLPDPQP